MTAQDILDALHDLNDSRKAVAEEYKVRSGDTLTIQHMPSWARSVKAEKKVHQLLLFMPRHAIELELPASSHAEKAAALSHELAEIRDDKNTPPSVSKVCGEAVNEISVLAHQVYYKISKAGKRTA